MINDPHQIHSIVSSLPDYAVSPNVIHSTGVWTGFIAFGVAVIFFLVLNSVVMSKML